MSRKGMTVCSVGGVGGWLTPKSVPIACPPGQLPQSPLHSYGTAPERQMLEEGYTLEIGIFRARCLSYNLYNALCLGGIVGLWRCASMAP